MEIVFSTNHIGLTGFNRCTPVELSLDEQKFVEIALKQVFQHEQLKEHIIIDQRSSNYKTIAYNVDYDFMRFKIGSKSKWFSILPHPNDKTDKLFDLVKNKKTLHWKIQISDIGEVEQYCGLILNAAVYAAENSSNIN